MIEIRSPSGHSGAHGRAPTGWLAAAAISMVMLTGCDTVEAGTPLANAERSEEALVEAVLEALASEDREALQGFLVSREEYEDLIWPSLPDGTYTSFEFVWGLNETNSRKGLNQLLGEFGGVELELVGLSFPSEPEVYESFTLHFDAEVTVRRPDTGEEGVLPTFDVLVEYGDGWKLLNYDEL